MLERLHVRRHRLQEAERTAIDAEIKAVAEQQLARLEAVRQRATEEPEGRSRASGC